MREITFEMTPHDWQEGLRMGLSHMTPFYRVIWICLLLLLPVGLILVLLFAEYLTPWPPTRLPLRPRFLEMGVVGVSLLAGYGLDIVLICFLVRTCARSHTVQLLPLHLVYQHKIGSNRLHLLHLGQDLRWKHVTAIFDTGEHLCFCQNYPCATVIPKAAFPNPEQANAFLEQAEHYWRRETGRKNRLPLDASGVWPPAPRAGDSQELGETPKH